MTHPSIDHAVLPVESLVTARARLAELGFTVAPIGNHPFGTSNCCIFLADGTFLEPLAVADGAAADKAVAGGNVFVTRDASYRALHGRDGFSALVLRTDDANADHTRFASAGISAGQVLEFSRFVDAAGKSDRASFRLAFAAEKTSPATYFFTCQRVRSPAVDRSALQVHRNGVNRLTAIVATAQDVARHTPFLEKFFGTRPDANGVVDLGGHRFNLMTPKVAEGRFGIAVRDQGNEMLLRGLVFSTSDLDATKSVLRSAGVDCEIRGERLCVQPAPGQGAVFLFEADQ